MHHRISTLLHALRQDLAAKLDDDVIRAACRAAGHTWCDSCLLTPAAIIHWFLLQVLHGNTALTEVSLMAGRAFSASAFCQARARLPLAVFRALLRQIVRAVIPDTEAIGRWHDHRKRPANYIFKVDRQVGGMGRCDPSPREPTSWPSPAETSTGPRSSPTSTGPA